MNTRGIKARHGHRDTKLGTLIRELCDEIESLRRNIHVKDEGYRQVIKVLKAKIYLLEHGKIEEAA